MCGRFAQVIKHEQLVKLARELRLQESSLQEEISFNVAPSHTVMSIVAKGDICYFGYFRWGLVPSWMKEIPRSPMINVRAESIFEKPSFKASILRRRGVIPVNGFYEWRQGDRQPFYICSKKEEYLYLGIIYDLWQGDDGSYLPTMAIITTQANYLISSLHHRMPLILTREDIADFLAPKMVDKKEIGVYLKPMLEDTLRMYPVSRAVNKVANNYPALLEEIEIEQEIV